MTPTHNSFIVFFSSLVSKKGDVLNRKTAIIGYSFRLPGTDASNIWEDLCAGRNLVTEVDVSRWSKDSFLHPQKAHPGCSYTFAAGSIGDVSGFDAGFFGISPREAACIDPQQRLLLELAWEAMENAGTPPSSLRGSNSGVYIGISTGDYSYRLSEDLAAIDATVATGNSISIAANRISSFFDLHGPSMAIDTACSSSLVAFHQACCAIACGEIDSALTGGVSLHLHPYGFLIFAQASMLSPRGRCNVFDASADGYVRSEGGGIFLLKEYEQAVADGDNILAVVAASAVNADGRKSSLTVPSALAQAYLIEKACRQAGLEPADIDYFEAHGTGTPVGDPIEARALGEALGKRRAIGNPLLIGSIKSNLGHLEAAAGVAGLVKALLSLQYRLVPPSIGITTLNPAIDFTGLNLEVVTKNHPLKPEGTLNIGVNSFGFGGVNAHVILEGRKADAGQIPAPVQSVELPLIISAKDELALKSAASDMALLLEKEPDLPFYDVAFGTMFHRDMHPFRAVLFGTDSLKVAEELRSFSSGAPDKTVVEHGIVLSDPSGPVFVYDGNGAQWEGMGRGLLDDPLFLDVVKEIDLLFRQYADFSLLDELQGRNGTGRYEFTEVAQPALFAIQVGLTCMLKRAGVEPVAVVGHSVGEIAAAWTCGALTLPDAVKVVYHRSRLQGMTRGLGEMTAVSIGSAKAVELLSQLALPSLTLAACNSPNGVTIAGSASELDQLELHLKGSAIIFRRLALDYAFHSSAMDCIETELIHLLAGVVPGEALVPFYSTVSGAPLSGKELDAAYWWKNIRYPVLFEQAVGAIIDLGTNIFVSVTPHAILGNYLLDNMKSKGVGGVAIPTALRGDDGSECVRKAAAKALIAGAVINLRSIFPKPGRFVRLPNYPWQRERHWYQPTPESLRTLERSKLHPLLGYRLQQHELTWENQLDTALYPMLADHAVGGAVLFPATGYLELVLAAAFFIKSDRFHKVEQLEIRTPLILEKGITRLIRVTVAPDNGSVTIKGRDLLSDSPWTIHCAARIVPASSEWATTAVPFTPPTRTPDFDTHSHKFLTSQAGLQYGPAFQAIRHGWLDGYSALAVLQTPDLVKTCLDGYQLHPTFMDNAFQLLFQIVQAERSSHAGMTYIPVTIEHISYQSGMSPPMYATATLAGYAPHSLTADFALYDAEGRSIATASQVRFKRIRLQKHGMDILCYPNFHRIPKPLSPTVVKHPESLLELVNCRAASAAIDAAAEKTSAVFVEELDPLLETLCNRFTVEALKLVATDSCHVGEAVLQQLYTDTPQLESFVEIMIADGSVLKNGADLLIQTDDPGTISAQTLWQGLINQYTDRFSLIHRVGRVGLQLSGQTCGEIQQGDVHSELLQQALGAGGRFVLGHFLQQLVADLLQGLPEGDRLTVMEFSEGAPLWLDYLCNSLDFERGEYHFASASSTALGHAKLQREQYHAINLHDISQAEETVAATAHLAIVTSDFGSQTNAEQAITAATLSLAPGGCVILVGMRPLSWANFLTGNEENWQPQSNWWQDYLLQIGYESVRQFDLYPRSGAGSWLMTAQKQAVAAVAVNGNSQRTLLLLHDDKGSSADMAVLISDVIAAGGNRCLRIDGSSEKSLQQSLAEAGELPGLLFLKGLGGSSNDPPDGDAYLADQVKRYADVSTLVLSLEKQQFSAPVWLLTTGAAADVVGWTVGEQGVSTIADSSFWAFGRTLMNEYATLDLRLICLEGGMSEDAVAALQQEFERSDGEQEVIITPAGKRYVPRLALESSPVAPRNAQIDSSQTNVRLGFQFPGQLRNLRWEQHPRVAPIEDQIEIEVYATGLNFRDIMYTLGLLSDEAVENGFAGATLGLECAGIVTRTGPGATDFAPGDRVVAFGSASFATRVITRVSAAAHIPAELSFESAATIPTTFFTAWYALCHLGRIQPGEKVLIHGAAGGIGLAAIQIARWLGADVYATAGTDEKKDFLRHMGVRHIFDSRSLDFADQILRQTGGRGVDLVLNSLAGEAINSNLQVLKPFGRFMELGKRDFYENTRIGLRPFRNNISFFGIDADQIMQMQPELTRRLFGEIMALFKRGVLHPLPCTLFEANQVVDAFRYMQQSRQIGKVVVTYRNSIRHIQPMLPDVPQILILNPDTTWLVTGGLGGFGLRTARWLVSKGCRNLALVSRNGSSGIEAQKAINELHEMGIHVYAAVCDVTSRDEVAHLLKAIERELPPLRGIVHAASVIDDGLLRTMQPEQIRRVLAPKILGAMHLHHLTKDMPLDYFVLFSSVTTLFGNPGQGNYVAANGWLEGLARMRRAAGLPATAVRWGVIDDVGFLARNQKIKESLLGRIGGTPLHSDTALASLEQILLSDRSGVGVMELDWSALRRFLPTAGHAKFAGMSALYGNDAVDDERTMSMLGLDNLSDTELQSVVTGILQQEVAQILQMQADKVSTERSLHDMGLDSLMGVELVTALESRFGIQLPVMALTEGPTIARLTTRVVAHIRGGERLNDDHLHDQVAQMAHLHAAEVTEVELAGISAGVAVATSDKMID